MTTVSAAASTSRTLPFMSSQMCGISRSMYSRFAPISLALDTSDRRSTSCMPLPISSSMSVTIGDSRRSSVPALKPGRARRRSAAGAPSPCRTRARSACGCSSSDGREHRRVDVELLARGRRSARRSFGRHEPPNAKPGLQVARRDVELPVLGRRAASPRGCRCRAPCRRCRSRWRSRPSAPWKQLQAYFTISATRDRGDVQRRLDARVQRRAPARREPLVARRSA